MTLQTAEDFSTALKVWEDDYQAGHTKLTLLELQEIKGLLSRILEQVDRDFTGPYSRPALAPPDDAGMH